MFKEKATRQIIELNNEVQTKAREHYGLLSQLKEERKKCVELYKKDGDNISLAQENERLQSRLELKVSLQYKEKRKCRLCDCCGNLESTGGCPSTRIN